MEDKEQAETTSKDFIRRIVEEDVKQGRNEGRVVTRFPPEPNGFLHIGHAKSICLNFGIANEYSSVCHLRFDDTDPTKEDVQYEEAIQEDVHWLGFDWQGRLFHASDYFEKMYEYAIQLIKGQKAYVCGLTEEQIRAYRGTVTSSGKVSPFFEKHSVAENLDLFQRMRAGEFSDGAYVLRARIDMASPNMKMRDPLLYRIRHAHHYRTGDKWCLYPMYDYAHPLSDAIEGITHSICTLEFENNRELYDWVLDNVQANLARPRQYEFARLDLANAVMSKRKLLQLVENKLVSGWDDPRLPTIAGLRRRGCTPESIRRFCELVGVSKANSTVEMAQLEFCWRDDLNTKAPRVMAVLRPLKVIIDNWPEGEVDTIDASYWPHDIPKTGSRPINFTKEIYIEKDDFAENPPKDFFRLAPGREVRLRYGYCITCTHVDKDASGEITAVHCTYDPETRSGNAPTGRKVKGTIHWVGADSITAEVRLYHSLLLEAVATDEEVDFLSRLNPNSLETLTDCRLEPSLAQAKAEDRYQFERQGYFFVDPVDFKQGKLAFNRIVTLKDSWSKKAAKK